MTAGLPLERVLRRERVVTLAVLALLCALAWIYIVMGAGLGMSAWDMTALTLFPHRGPSPPSSAAWSLATWSLMTAMWWTMMIAMMTPSAAPTILLYARVHHHALAKGQIQDRRAPTGAFAAGYLLVWLGFAVVATALQWAAERAGLVSDMMMGSRSRWLSAAVLIGAGVYQLSPLKGACLSHCRSPAGFLSRHWRIDTSGAVRLGVLHGAYCVGCCWMLMALLFVGGAMNLAWIAALAVLVMIEKIAPVGRWVGRVAGVLLVGWGTLTFLV